MTIHFNPSLSQATVDSLPLSTRGVATLMVAPPSLTPLSPPASGKPVAPLIAEPATPAAERRLAYFGDLHRQLLDKAVHAASPPGTGSAAASVLSPALRADCVVALQRLASRPLDDAGGA